MIHPLHSRNGEREEVGDLAAAVSRRDMELSSLSIRLMHVMPPMDHGKAERELGWHPAPIHDSIERAAHWYRARC
jgi:dihydroflavonol-4-reductase